MEANGRIVEKKDGEMGVSIKPGAHPTAMATRELVPCRVCFSNSWLPYLEGRGYTIVQCRDCGLRYVNPQPSVQELEELYSRYDSGSQWRSGEEHLNRSVRKEILRFKKEGIAVDVGSGSGNFLRGMREAGFKVIGVEPSVSGSEYARSAHGIETFNGTVEAVLASGTLPAFDVVTILNVLEHFKDPAAILAQLRSLLREDGIIAVVVPDSRFHAVLGEIRRRLGFSDPFWMNTERHPLVGFDPPDHLCSFEPRTILSLLEKCGFGAVSIKNAPVVFNSDRWKNLAKIVVRFFSGVLYELTFHKLIFGYSTLVIARKRAPRK